MADVELSSIDHIDFSNWSFGFGGGKSGDMLEALVREAAEEAVKNTFESSPPWVDFSGDDFPKITVFLPLGTEESDCRLTFDLADLIDYFISYNSAYDDSGHSTDILLKESVPEAEKLVTKLKSLLETLESAIANAKDQ